MKYDKSVFKALALITQLGISMIVPILLCALLGNFIDNKWSAHTMLPLLILGVVAGFRNTYILLKGFIGNDKEDKKH